MGDAQRWLGGTMDAAWSFHELAGAGGIVLE
jgi:hypothetical protein